MEKTRNNKFIVHHSVHGCWCYGCGKKNMVLLPIWFGLLQWTSMQRSNQSIERGRKVVAWDGRERKKLCTSSIWNRILATHTPAFVFYFCSLQILHNLHIYSHQCVRAVDTHTHAQTYRWNERKAELMLAVPFHNHFHQHSPSSSFHYIIY